MEKKTKAILDEYFQIHDAVVGNLFLTCIETLGETLNIEELELIKHSYDDQQHSSLLDWLLLDLKFLRIYKKILISCQQVFWICKIHSVWDS